MIKTKNINKIQGCGAGAGAEITNCGSGSSSGSGSFLNITELEEI
jgi:hypothetical protein